MSQKTSNMPSQSPQQQPLPLRILAVGSAYEDTILYVDKFPPEDGKQRAQRVEKRRGGNSGNTLTVLSQFPSSQPYFMASMASKEASTFLVQDFEAHNIKTSTCLFRANASHAPVAYIIHAENTSSRTIINYNSIDELTFEEFKGKFEEACAELVTDDLNQAVPFSWIHFEGRNTEEVAKMMDYIDTKEWRDRCIMSVELEKPHRKGLEDLMHRADVVFFSKVFAEGKGYDHAGDFLQVMGPYCKKTAYLFCTWGNSGASCFHNPTQKLFIAPALPIPSVVDSVGAGDTFIAGVIYGLTQGMPPERCLKFACELAGRKCAQQPLQLQHRRRTANLKHKCTEFEPEELIDIKERERLHHELRRREEQQVEEEKQQRYKFIMQQHQRQQQLEGRTQSKGKKRLFSMWRPLKREREMFDKIDIKPSWKRLAKKSSIFVLFDKVMRCKDKDSQPYSDYENDEHEEFIDHECYQENSNGIEIDCNNYDDAEDDKKCVNGGESENGVGLDFLDFTQCQNDNSVYDGGGSPTDYHSFYQYHINHGLFKNIIINTSSVNDGIPDLIFSTKTSRADKRKGFLLPSSFSNSGIN
ncbi:3539_t:CDS:2 [Ambispora leptoticha]|uniref:3539_t:CDS:1 n=1 Tax=Ambispora leptoticha TaxID=144679 RepID=A0A9N9GJL7_9GLOM|nr:3539_t:CDS:2 [Ambispora leptoticha]